MSDIIRGRYFVPFTKVKLTPGKVYFFEDRKLSVINMVHYFLNDLGNDQEITLIYKDREDAREIVMYFDLPAWKRIFENKKTGGNTNQTSDTQWLDELIQILDKDRKAWTDKILTRYSLADLSDHLRIGRQDQPFLNLKLDNSSDLLDIYKDLREQVVHARDMYAAHFKHMDYTNPFSRQVTDLFSFAQLKDKVEEFVLAARQSFEEILKEADAINRSRYEHLYAERDKVWTLYTELKTVVEAAGESKAVISPNKLKEVRQQLTARDMPIQPDEVPEVIVSRLKTLLEMLDAKLQNTEGETNISYSRDQSFLEEMYLKVDGLQEEIIASGIFRNFIKSKAAGLELNLTLLKDIRGRLESALDILRENEAYFQWLNYKKNLGKRASKLISYLEEQERMWDEAFERVFFENVFYMKHRNVRPRHHLLQILKTHHREFENASIRSLLPRKQKVVLKDAEAVDGKPAGLVLYLDCMPGQMNPDTLVVLRNRDMYEKTQKNLSHPVEIIDRRYLRDTASFTELPSSDKLHQSLYLGNSIHEMNPAYRIFELKGISIVSYLSDIKNSYLLESLNDLKFKEIRSDKEGDNLLPGILSNESNLRMIVTEDGTITDHESTHLLAQLNLFNKLKSADIEVRHIFNYNYRLDGFEELDRFIDEIRAMHKN